MRWWWVPAVRMARWSLYVTVVLVGGACGAAPHAARLVPNAGADASAEANDAGQGATDLGRDVPPPCPRAVSATLQGFASYPGLATIAAVSDTGRLVSISQKRGAPGSRLTLARIEDDRVALLDQVDSPLPTGVTMVSPIVWVQRPNTFVLPLSGDRVAIVGDGTATGKGAAIDIYDTSGDVLTLSSHLPLALAGSALRGAATDGQRLWTCTNPQLSSYEIDPSGALIPGPTFGGSLAGYCESLAASPDGQTLYVSTTKGLFTVDISAPDGTMIRRGQALTDGVQLILDVARIGDYLAVFRLGGMVQADGSYFASGGYGDLLILDATTLEQVDSIPMDLTAGHATPVGFAAVGDRLVVQRESNDCLRYTAEVYDVGPGGLIKLDEITPYDSCPSPPTSIVPLHVGAGAGYVILDPAHQVVRVDAATGALIPVASPQQGSFERLLAVGPHALAASSPLSRHLVDLTVPTAPTFTAGGPFMPLDAGWVRVQVSPDAAASLLTVPTLSRPASGAVVTLVKGGDNQSLPAVLGNVATDDPNAQWMAAGKWFFEVWLEDADSFRLRRFAATAVAGAGAGTAPTLTSDFDGTVATVPPPDSGPRDGRPVDMWTSFDQDRGRLVVADYRLNAAAAAGGVFLLSWFDSVAGVYQLAGTKALDPGTSGIPDTILGASNGVIVLALKDHLTTVSEDDDSTSTMAFDPKQFSVTRLLGFDAGLIYLAVSFPGSPVTTGAVVVRQADGLEVERFTTPEAVRSMAEVGDNLAFGMDSTIVIAAPTCPAP